MMDHDLDKAVTAIVDDADMDEIIQVATQLVAKAQHADSKGMSMANSSEEDNMDYDSDEDDDDSKSNSSNRNNKSATNGNSSATNSGGSNAGAGAGGTNKKRLKGEVKRSHHNVLERKRRDLIKDSFTKLKDVVPTLTSERASRAQILKKAADFIQLTHQRNESSKSVLKELIRKNAELESKISSNNDGNETAQTQPTTTNTTTTTTTTITTPTTTTPS